MPAPFPTTEQKPAPAAAKNDSIEPAISIQNVCKAFGPQVVLDGLSFDVHRGETIAVLGRSGTGKSVLLKIIVGLQVPDSGGAYVLGKNMAEVNERELAEVRKQMGFLFQNAALYDSLSIEDNIAFPLVHHQQHLSKSDRMDRVEKLLKEVGLEGHGKKFPANISGGMKKRAGLARALALEPVVLLLDEPTAGLDPISSGEIDELIMDLQKRYRMASIVVTHDLISARTMATRIALLNKGRVALQGSYEDLQNSKEPFVSEFLHRDS